MIAALGPHADFIVLSYAAAVVAVAGLIGWIGLDHRQLNKALADLEARGITRRSGRSAARLEPVASPPGRPPA